MYISVALSDGLSDAAGSAGNIASGSRNVDPSDNNSQENSVMKLKGNVLPHPFLSSF